MPLEKAACKPLQMAFTIQRRVIRLGVNVECGKKNSHAEKYNYFSADFGQ
jgi:hypothetical protein